MALLNDPFPSRADPESGKPAGLDLKFEVAEFRHQPYGLVISGLG